MKKEYKVLAHLVKRPIIINIKADSKKEAKEKATEFFGENRIEEILDNNILLT